jgi:hypothetical protein
MVYVWGQGNFYAETLRQIDGLDGISQMCGIFL